LINFVSGWRCIFSINSFALPSSQRRTFISISNVFAFMGIRKIINYP